MMDDQHSALPEQLDTEDWKEIKRIRQAERAARLPAETEEILALGELGYTITKISEFQYRVNGLVDLYPTRRRFHVFKSGRRGRYKTAMGFIKDAIPDPSQTAKITGTRGRPV